MVITLLAAMLVTDPGRLDARSAKVRAIRIAMVLVLVLGAAWATGALIHDILDGDWAKLAMAVQSVASLAVLGLVIASAVNVLG